MIRLLAFLALRNTPTRSCRELQRCVNPLHRINRFLSSSLVRWAEDGFFEAVKTASKVRVAYSVAKALNISLAK